MQPKLTSVLERLEKAPDLLSRRTWPRPCTLTRAQPRCSKKYKLILLVLHHFLALYNEVWSGL